MIQIHDLKLTYASGFQLAINQLHIAPGEKVAIVGKSGSGKSTLLKLIAGVLQPDAGSIALHGQRLNKLSTAQLRRLRATQIGFVFQELELLEYLTVAENILLPHTLGLAAVSDARREMQRLATSVGIAERLQQRPAELSQGERQRVALCRALITRPALLLADEPTGNLDADSARQAMQLMLQQVEHTQSTLLVVTHDPEC